MIYITIKSSCSSLIFTSPNPRVPHNAIFEPLLHYFSELLLLCLVAIKTLTRRDYKSNKGVSQSPATVYFIMGRPHVSAHANKNLYWQNNPLKISDNLMYHHVQYQETLNFSYAMCLYVSYYYYYYYNKQLLLYTQN